MKIYAIWKYSNETQTIIKSAYCSKFVEGNMNALQEQTLLKQRQTNTESNCYVNSKISLKEFKSYQALSFHGQLATINGCCLLAGDKDMLSLSKIQKFFLLKNILKSGRSLADVIRAPEKYIDKYYFSTRLTKTDVTSNASYITHTYDFNSPSNLNNCQKSGTTFFVDPRYPDHPFKNKAELLDFEKELIKERAELMRGSFCLDLLACLGFK